MLDAKKICIVRLGGLGDVINTLPALDALRAARPDAHIAWLVESPWQDVLPVAPRLDEVIAVPKQSWLAKLRDFNDLFTLPGEVRAFVRELRARSFDLVIDFHGNLRSGVATLVTGAKDRVGFAPDFCKEFNHLFTNRRYPVGGAPDGAGHIHRIDRVLELAKAIGAQPVADTPRVDVRQDALAFARQAFQEAGLSTRPVVAVHPGTSRFGEYKRWPVERYAGVIRLMAEREARSLITWGPGEEAMARTAAADTTAVIAPQTNSVAQLAALLSLCDAFIGADSGPAVLAAAVGTPPVTIFGTKNPAVYATRHPRSRVVEIPLDCRPCKKRTCDDPKCVLDITIRHVAAAAFSLLDEMKGNCHTSAK